MAVIIGAFGMMNTLLMSVFERTREIGTLRAFGWRRLRVLRMVLGESLTLSIIGGIMGIFLGMAALRGLGRIPAVASILPGSLSLDLLLRAIFTALSLGAIGGAYPAWWASNLLPLEAIRYEGGARGASYVIGGMAFRNLLRRRTRSLLTMVGVGISIMAVVAFGALSDGIIAQFVAISTRSGAELTLREAGTSMDYSTIDERVGKKIAQIPGVKHVGGMIYGYAKGREVPWFIVFGYHPKSRGINYFKIVEGEAISANRQMIIGRVAAEILDKRVGDTMKLFDTTFRIVGIYETGIAFEDGGGVISLRDAQILFKKPRQVTFYGVHLEDPDIAEEVRRRIEEDFPELAVSFSSDFVEETEDIKTIRAITGAIFFLAILVGGVGMTNTMVMSVFERTREIGVLRALGWRRARVLWMILKESLLLSAISGVFGIIMGVILCKMLSGFPVAAMMVRVNFTPSLLARSFSMALLLGAIGGLYPAWRATRLSPVEALRYE
jgi:ABC-type antimicrobial peptide transport system permease subunit